MAKVVRNVSLDYDVVEEFKLTQQKGKLSSVINDLLRNYLNVQQKELQPKEKLEHRKKKILEAKANIDAELLDVRTQLMEHDNKESEYTSIKEKFWNEFILRNLPKFPREKYDANYEEKFQQKAIEYSKGKK